MLKATREAKINTSWINPHVSYEQAMLNFIDAILAAPAQLFPKNSPYPDEIADFGMWNSLSQTLLKLTSPGVPDFYQGTERGTSVSSTRTTAGLSISSSENRC